MCWLRRSRHGRFFADESGVVTPLVLLLMVLLLGFGSLALDAGLVYANRRNLQNAADAAALAGARDLERELLGGPADPAARAADFAGRNSVSGTSGDCPSSPAATLIANRSAAIAHGWEVQTSRTVPLLFGRFIGHPTQCVRARAVAVVVDLKVAKIWPFGVLRTVPRPPGGNVVLKQGAPGGTKGNYGIVDFDCGGGGTPDYRYWAFNGYGTRAGENVPVRVPPGTWTICTEPGNKAAVNRDLGAWISAQQAAGCEFPEPDVRCPLIGMVPIIGLSDWPNGNKSIPVIDLAIFRLEGVSVEGGNGHSSVVGTFLQYAGGVGPTYPPEPTGNLSGVIGARLWE